MEIFRSLIRQLAEQVDVIPEEIIALRARRQGQQQTLTSQELIQIFRLIGYRFGKVSLIIDAVDECHEIAKLISMIKSLESGWKNGSLTSLRVLLTGRSLETLEQMLKPDDTLEVVAEEIDVKSYLEWRVEGSEMLNELVSGQMRMDIVDKVANHANGL